MNTEVQLTLDDAVAEVLALLTGLDLTYDPTMDRYRAVVRQLNRALRQNALETEWSYYASTESVGPAAEGDQHVLLRSSVRPRIINDDAVRLCRADGQPVIWAYFLPRDALHKYAHRPGLWCSATYNTLSFSRPFFAQESGLDIQVPVMREPRMFRLPAAEGELVPAETLDQLVDFDYPDVIILRAAWLYAQTDPVMQPRVQTLEAQYKDLMYQLIERDSRNTDAPYTNEFVLPIESGISAPGFVHGHPHADNGRR